MKDFEGIKICLYLPFKYYIRSTTLRLSVFEPLIKQPTFRDATKKFPFKGTSAEIPYR